MEQPVTKAKGFLAKEFLALWAVVEGGWTLHWWNLVAAGLAQLSKARSFAACRYQHHDLS